MSRLRAGARRSGADGRTTARRRGWPARLVGLAVVVAVLAPSSPALAYWRPVGAGSGSASAAGLEAPRAVTAVMANAGSDDVLVTWDAARLSSDAVDGYRVQRRPAVGPPATPVPACGTGTDPLESGDRVCTDTRVPDGFWQYEVVALYRSWTSTGAAAGVTVRLDTRRPTMVATLQASAGATLRDNRIYVRTGVAGSFRLTATITDAAAGPASATFPRITPTGWTHALETVTSGTGSPSTVAYQSAPFTWLAGATSPGSLTVAGTDRNGNTLSVTLTSHTDDRAPTGGDLRVNGAGSATAPGAPATWSTTGSFAIARTDYVEVPSTSDAGLRSSVLTRETAALAAGACGPFGTPTVLTGAPAQAGLDTGCYRYTLTGTDVLGNTVSRSAVVKVDRTPPAGSALSVNGTAATAAGSQSSTTSRTVPVVRVDGADADSGLASVAVVRTQAAVVNGQCAATFGTPATIVGTSDTVSRRVCYRYVLTATNAAGGASTLTTTVVVGPFVTGLATSNAAGGTAGQMGPGDRVTITFSDALRPTSICTDWGASGDQTLSTDSLLVSVSATDTLTVTGGCAVGSIALGGDVATAARTFGGATGRTTLVWDDAARMLTVTLGDPSAAVPAPVGAIAPVYTPSHALTTPSGAPLGGTFTAGAAVQF